MADRKQEILDAALELADDKGLDAVSMRAIAERTGVTPMALYPHVGSKAALLDGMLGRVIGQILADEGSTLDSVLDWRERLRLLLRGARQLAHRHPWLAALAFSRPSATADSASGVDLFYTALLDAGVPPAEVPRLERILTTLALGYGASEVGGRFAREEGYVRARRGELGDAPLPGHKALIRWLMAPADWDAEFEADVDDLVRLVEAVAARRSAHGEQEGADDDHRGAGEPGHAAGGGGPGSQDLPGGGPQA
jgi:AcrR family transcriptional regulator